MLICPEASNVLRDAKSIEAADPLAGDMESGTSRGDATHIGLSGSRLQRVKLRALA
jgi:hypothetical protein